MVDREKQRHDDGLLMVRHHVRQRVPSELLEPGEKDVDEYVRGIRK